MTDFVVTPLNLRNFRHSLRMYKWIPFHWHGAGRRHPAGKRLKKVNRISEQVEAGFVQGVTATTGQTA
jgi:hypothetical protein